MTPISRRCCVCGSTLPAVPLAQLIAKGAATLQPDGSYRYHCIGRHTAEEISRAESPGKEPAFRRASEGRKNIDEVK